MFDLDVSAESVYLTFFIETEEYALPLTRVSRVVGCERLTRVPKAPPFVRGLVSVAGAAVPVVDLSRKFNAAQSDSAGNQSIVVVHASIGGKSTLLGFVVDRLGRVLRISSASINAPDPLDSLISVEFLTGTLENDGFFVLFVDIDRVLDVDEFACLAGMAEAPAPASVDSHEDAIPFLTIRLAGERCALNLSRLRETVVCERLTRIPGAPAYVLGAMNVRGAIVAVIDVAKRCGLRTTCRHPKSRLVLADVGADEHDAPVGFLVDAVEGLVRIPPNQINRTPPFGTRFPGEMVEGIASVGDALFLILNTERALSPDEKDAPNVSGELNSIDESS
jgi:purine-binding chemotaxis protein CheW